MPNIASLVQRSNGQTNDWKKKVKHFNFKVFIKFIRLYLTKIRTLFGDVKQLYHKRKFPSNILNHGNKKQ